MDEDRKKSFWLYGTLIILFLLAAGAVVVYELNPGDYQSYLGSVWEALR